MLPAKIKPDWFNINAKEYVNSKGWNVKTNKDNLKISPCASQSVGDTPWASEDYWKWCIAICWMSNFPSTAAVHTSENSSIAIQNHILCYFPSKSSLSLHCENAHTESLVYSLLLVFTRLFSSFVLVHLLSFTCLPGSASSLLTSLFWSSEARTKFTF